MDALSFAGFLNWDRMDNDGSGDILKVSKQWGVKFNMETEKKIFLISLLNFCFLKFFHFHAAKCGARIVSLWLGIQPEVKVFP